MFYGRYNDLDSNYNVSVRHMLAEVLHTCKTIIYNVATTPMHLIPFCLLFFFRVALLLMCHSVYVFDVVYSLLLSVFIHSLLAFLIYFIR